MVEVLRTSSSDSKMRYPKIKSSRTFVGSLHEDRKKILRFLIFAYLFAILYDGIFRKWLLPSFSTPLMMVKQVIAVLICAYGFPYFSRLTIWEKSFAIIGALVFGTTFIFGHQNLFVALYGCLSYWFGLPVCFIIGKILGYDDLKKIGKIFVQTSIFNSILIILQFNLPVTHILNYQTGGLDANIIGYSVSSLEGGFRPSGIFVYNSQNAMFQMLAFSFILFFLFMRGVNTGRYVQLVALILNLLSLPFSVSRTNFFYQIGVAVFFLLFCLQKSQRKKYLSVLSVSLIVLLFSSRLSMVNSAIRSISARFANASEVQYGEVSTTQGTLKDLWDRNVSYNIDAIIDPHTIDGDPVPFWGYGQGMSTQVGGRMLGVTKNAGFALAEWDGLRIMCESGLLFGWAIIFIRVGYAFRYVFSILRFKRRHKYLSLILLPSFLVCFFLLNNWGNIFQANFAFFVGGLFMASIKFRIYDHKPLLQAPDTTD